MDSQGHTFGKTRRYVYDGLGSVVGEMDPNGNMTSSPKYDVYGLVRSNSGTASSKMGFVGGLGHLSEANTGLIYMRARYYDPNNGRFSSEDYAKDGFNWYIYCSNNPTNHIDMDGRSDVGEASVGYGLLAVSLIWCACVAMEDSPRALMTFAIIAAAGGVAFLADALKDAYTPNGAAAGAMWLGFNIRLNMMFGGAKGQGIKVMSTLIPSLGNAIAATVTTSVVCEVYMLLRSSAN